ncbi:MAG: hypothetical protein ACYS1C_03875 [Planctomycetota bacterium]|jgi:hypothetical protein
MAHDWNGIAGAGDGSLFVVDAEDGQIWMISPNGQVSVFFTGKVAKCCIHPHHLALDTHGQLWLAGG